MGITLDTLAVVTVGTSAVQASTTSLETGYAVFTADPTNSVKIYMGASDVATTTGIPMDPGESIIISDDKGGYDNGFDLSEIYFRSGSASQKVRINYFPRNK